MTCVSTQLGKACFGLPWQWVPGLLFSWARLSRSEALIFHCTLSISSALSEKPAFRDHILLRLAVTAQPITLDKPEPKPALPSVSQSYPLRSALAEDDIPLSWQPGVTTLSPLWTALRLLFQLMVCFFRNR